MNNPIKHTFDMRSKIIKTIKIMILIQYMIGFSSISAHAGLKKKIGLEPFQNPPKWAGAFDPGSLLADMIKKSVLVAGDYRLVPESYWLSPILKNELAEIAMVEEETPDSKLKEVAKADSGDMDDKNPAVQKARHPAQVVIQGMILSLNTKLMPGATKNAEVEEQVEMDVEIALHNPRTERSIAVKRIKVIVKRGRQSLSQYSVNDSAFRNSSIGEAMNQISRMAAIFINDEMGKHPFDADVIWVSKKKDRVIINAGTNDGIKPLGLFTVYYPKKHYQDPDSKADLGDRRKQTGVVKIESVQEEFSVARIMAGNNIEPGSLIRVKRYD